MMMMIELVTRYGWWWLWWWSI